MEISAKERKRAIRNLVIFSVVALSCGFVGITLDRLSPPQDPMQGLGALVWLVSPLAANLLLRLVGGDGWKDFGLRPNLRSGWVWYLVALLIAPLVVQYADSVGTRVFVGVACSIVLGGAIWYSKSRKSELMIEPEAKEEAAVS